MDQDQLHEQENKCIQESPPGCTAGCPAHVDVRGMITSIRKNDFSAAFTIFRKAVPFPGIISRICDQPCMGYCKRGEVDAPVEIRALERTCVDYNATPPGKAVIPPLKNKKIAIIGAGLSGLAAAIDLAQKGLATEIFEASGRIGGKVNDISEQVLPGNIIRDDFTVIDSLPVTVNLNTEIAESGTSFDAILADFDAVYVGTGNGTLAQLKSWLHADNMEIDPVSLYTGFPKVFAGGSLRDGSWSPIASISAGKAASNSINRFLQNASLTANRGKEGSYITDLYTGIKDVRQQPATPVSDPLKGYNTEEAATEAERCLLCQCMECVKECEYLAHYSGYPRKYVREIYNNLSIVMGIHHSNRMINSCSLCGLCADICPNDLDMGEICLNARQLMVRNGKMPPSAHEFALRDMDFSNSDRFMLAKHQPGTTASSAVFFPGCQLSASYPDHVRRIYEYLCSVMSGGVGLILSCCGAPALWAGREELFAGTAGIFKKNWENLGKPAVITACPSCYFMLRQGLPELNVETLWTLLDRTGLPGEEKRPPRSGRIAVHDSCVTRHDENIHNSIRNIITKTGYEAEELPGNRNRTVCCGYGGLMNYVNREVAAKVISRRISESGSDYVSYCAMCRDNFAGQGKRSYHILDLILGSDMDSAAWKKVPGYSERQGNRSELKTAMLKDLWREDVDEKQPELNLIIPENMQTVLEDRMILVSDLIKVISNAENTGNRFINTDNGHYIAYFQPENVTYWVEYSTVGDAFTVHNAYCHRIIINS